MQQLGSSCNQFCQRCSITCCPNAQHGFFFGTEILGTMPTLGDSHSSKFGGNMFDRSNHPQPFKCVASNIGSVFPQPIRGGTAPNYGHQFATIHGKHCFGHRKRCWSRFWVHTPGVRCAPYLGRIIQFSPRPKDLICQKTPNSLPPPPSPIYKDHQCILLRQCSKRSSPGCHGHPWPVRGSRCWTRLAERQVSPLPCAPLLLQPASRPARLVLPILHAQTQTYTTTRMSNGWVS